VANIFEISCISIIYQIKDDEEEENEDNKQGIVVQRIIERMSARCKGAKYDIDHIMNTII
jgi:hypothetical protein